MDKIAKAIASGAGTAFAAYTAAQVSGHLTWLTLAGSLASGALVGLITWAVPNAPAAPAAGPNKE
jgi:hypothetical protein